MSVYPRTGGGNKAGLNFLLGLHGLSPHGRGKPSAPNAPASALGSIPARAGETESNGRTDTTTAVYPRTGGGNI